MIFNSISCAQQSVRHDYIEILNKNRSCKDRPYSLNEKTVSDKGLVEEAVRPGCAESTKVARPLTISAPTFLGGNRLYVTVTPCEETTRCV